MSYIYIRMVTLGLLLLSEESSATVCLRFPNRIRRTAGWYVDVFLPLDAGVLDGRMGRGESASSFIVHRRRCMDGWTMSELIRCIHNLHHHIIHTNKQTNSTTAPYDSTIACTRDHLLLSTDLLYHSTSCRETDYLWCADTVVIHTMMMI